MSIKTFKPTTPSRRQMTVSGFDGIDKKAKEKEILGSFRSARRLTGLVGDAIKMWRAFR